MYVTVQPTAPITVDVTLGASAPATETPHVTVARLDGSGSPVPVAPVLWLGLGLSALYLFLRRKR